MQCDSNQYQFWPLQNLQQIMRPSLVVFFCLVQTAMALTPAGLKTEYRKTHKESMCFILA